MDFLPPLPKKDLDELALQIVRDHLERVKYWATESHPQLVQTLSVEESLELNQIVRNIAGELEKTLKSKRSAL